MNFNDNLKFSLENFLYLSIRKNYYSVLNFLFKNAKFSISLIHRGDPVLEKTTSGHQLIATNGNLWYFSQTK